MKSGDYMAVTVEEIEIIVRAKVEEALKELRKVQPELQKIGAASLSNMSSLSLIHI